MNQILKHLVNLSDIFKNGFTIKISNGAIDQFFKNTGYIISVKTLIIISRNNTGIKQIAYQHITDNDFKDSIIGGWYDNGEKKYYIEKNAYVLDKVKALKLAKKLNQKEIFDLKNGVCLKV